MGADAADRSRGVSTRLSMQNALCTRLEFVGAIINRPRRNVLRMRIGFRQIRKTVPPGTMIAPTLSDEGTVKAERPLPFSAIVSAFFVFMLPFVDKVVYNKWVMTTKAKGTHIYGCSFYRYFK